MLKCSMIALTLIATNPNHVAAVAHEGRAGFFVPSALFRSMDKAYRLYPNVLKQNTKLQAEAHELRLANLALARTASVSVLSTELWKDAYERDHEALSAAQEALTDAGGGEVYGLLWTLLGAATTVAVVYAVKAAPD